MCAYLGTLECAHLSWVVSAASGLVYHYTPDVWRAAAITQRGWSLAEVCHGRSHGDGVYFRSAYEQAAGSGSGAVVVAQLAALPLLDMSEGDELQRFAAGCGDATRGAKALSQELLALGVGGVLCSWGGVVFEPSLVVALGYYSRPSATDRGR
jgi:hypothetical protein